MAMKHWKLINMVFQRGFFLAMMLAAAARAIPDANDRLTVWIIIAVPTFIGFNVWAAIGYMHAWMIAIEDIRAKWRAPQAPAHNP